MSKLRFFAALWAAKLSQPLLRITKHGGTTFPGKLAIKICPDFLGQVETPEKIIAVTGTNGKTTTANLIRDTLINMGVRVLDNHIGSNIDAGVATALLSGCTIFNKTKYDMAVLEVDERSSKKIYPYMEPDYLIITNLTRDSIMRNAHPQYIADFLSHSIPKNTKLILNADDLISVSVAPENDRVYFGIKRMPADTTECINRMNDMRICPKCNGRLKYEYVRYHHIGRAYCTKCGFKSPEYNYFAENVDVESMTMDVSDSENESQFKLISDSVFNIYNMVATISLLRELGYSISEIKENIEKVEIVGTRFRSEMVGDVRLIMQLAKDKNSTASTGVLNYVTSIPGEKELLLLLTCITDEEIWGENTSWLYDADFEFLRRPGVEHIVNAGIRNKDYYLRMLLAGVDSDKIDSLEDEMEAVDRLRLKPGSTVCVVYSIDTMDKGIHTRVHDKIVELIQGARAE